MPDIPNRDKEETALAGYLLTLFEEAEADALRLLGDPPDMRRLPPTFFEDFGSKVRQALLPVLVRIHQEAAGRMDVPGVTFDLSRATSDAQGWALARVRGLVRDLVDRVTESVRSAVRAYYENGADVAAAVAVVFSSGRANALAVNEITGALTQGEADVVRRTEEAWGVKLIALWVAEEGACEVCADLDGRPQHEWVHRFPSGPPQPHPHCRCRLEWIVV